MYSIINISGESQYIDVIEDCEIYIVCEDASNIMGMTAYNSASGLSIEVHKTDWSNDTNSHDNTTGDYQINVGGHNRYCSFSGDGKRLLITYHTSSSAGYARIFEYDEDSDKWGKFDASGSFSENEYHNLDRSSISGHYGMVILALYLATRRL